jgi:hypothetical protein
MQLGVGQQDASDSTTDFAKHSFLITQILARVRTMCLVEVMASTNDGEVVPPGTVNVRPLVNLIDGEGNASSHGMIFNIPVFRLQGGGNAIILDPEIGDIGWMAVADRDISSVKVNRARSNPGTFRRFDLCDGVYMGALLGNAPNQYVAFTPTGITIADMNENVITMGPAGITMTAPAGITMTAPAGITMTAPGVVSQSGTTTTTTPSSIVINAATVSVNGG